MKESKRGISSSVALLVVVVIIAAAFYVEIPMVSSNFTATLSTSVTTTSSASSSSSSSGSQSTTGTLTISSQQPLIVAPDNSESVALTLSAIGTVTGNYTLSATGLPQGVTASFSPSVLKLPADIQSPVTMTLTAATGATVANATMSLVATSGSSVFSDPTPMMSVSALVLIQGNAFHPSSLTVAAGTKVYWFNLDPSSSPDLGPDMHDVTALDHSFSSGTGDLGQYDIYGHTFTAAGTVQYESAQQGSGMAGSVTVTS